MKTYGVVGVGVYGSVTVVSISSLYLALRSGNADALITTSLEKVLGSDAEIVKTIKKQLEEARQTNNHQGQQSSIIDSQSSGTNIHWGREGMYLGIASVVDSIILPLKLGLCLPLTRQILKRRGR